MYSSLRPVELAIWLFGAIPDAHKHVLGDLCKFAFAECNLVALSFFFLTAVSRCMVVLDFYVLVLSVLHNFEQALM